MNGFDRAPVSDCHDFTSDAFEIIQCDGLDLPRALKP